jgi:UDP-N-acetylglucosamine transferase subunit ALG13
VIFVTVGTQLPFDRLVRAVDRWAGANPDAEVRAQIGLVSSEGYTPRHMESTPTLDPQHFERLFNSARLVVAHAGTGSLLQASTNSIPILIMPRRAEFGEHRNDHQLATAKHFGDLPGVHVAHEEEDIAPAIDRLLREDAKAPELRPTADPQLIAKIRNLIFRPD